MNEQAFPDIPDIRKIVVLRPNAIGDFVFSLPCLHTLKARHPDASIAYIGKQWHADFLTRRPGPIDSVVVLPPCPGINAAPEAALDPGPVERFIKDMQRAEYDLALQIYGGGQYSNPFLMRFGARLSIGMRAAGAPPLDRWVHYGDLQNRRLQMLEVAALAGADTLRMGRELEVTDQDRQQAAQALAPDPDKPLVLLQPGASDPRRRWPAERFAAVADALAAEGALVAINGSEQEAPVVREVIARMRYPAADLSGKLPLSALCGLLERARLLVSNDTGPLHLGLAIGTRCVGIYWLSNLLESGPLRQDGHQALLSVRIHCPVCGAENLKTRCEHDASFLDDVSVDEVIAAAMRLFHHE